MNPSKRLKKAREYLGLTQQELAEKLGFEWHKIKNIETEKHKLTPDIAQDIEQFYSIGGWWLLTGKGEMLLKEKKTPPQSTNLTDEEQELLYKFKKLPKELQEVHLQEIDRDLLDEAIKEKRKKHQNNPLQTPKDKQTTA